MTNVLIIGAAGGIARIATDLIKDSNKSKEARSPLFSQGALSHIFQDYKNIYYGKNCITINKGNSFSNKYAFHRRGRKLKVEYQYTFTLPRKWVWKWVKDETVLKNSITGCRSFNETTNGIYRGLIDIHFGPINDVFSLEVLQVQEKKPSFYRFRVKGKGNLGVVEGKMDLFLIERDGGTALTIKADAKFSGNLAIVSELNEEGLRNTSVERFFKKFEKEMKKAILYSRRKDR